MPTTTHLLQRIALFTGVIAIPLLIAGCATHHVPAAEPSAPALAAGHAIDPDAAAARAVAVSPRVRAAAHRLEASRERANAAALPPDPALAVSLGVPIDGLGGFPISISLMEGLSWLVHHDAIHSSAERERTVAASELLGATIEIAADARRLVRAVAAAREQVEALTGVVDARTAIARIEVAALDLGESTAARTAASGRQLAQARLELAAAALIEHELAASLASLLAIDRAPPVSAAIEDPADTLPLQATIDVVRARARVARAEAMLAANQGAFGGDAAIGPNFSRDIEDRESVGGAIEVKVPLFRRAHELAALRSDLAAEQAELAEAERRAALELDHAVAQVESARSTLAIALDGARTTEVARAALATAADDGEASRAAIAEATADAAEWRARAAERRIELANALFKIESRAATGERRTEAATAATTEGTNR